MKKQILTYTIKDLLEKNFRFSEVLSHGYDYLIVKLNQSKYFSIGKAYSYRFDGMVFLYCSAGAYEIEKNYSEITLTARNFMIIYPDDVIKSVNRVSDESGCMTALFLTRAFIRDINFNLNVFSSLDILGVKTPVINLSEDDFQHLTQYILLLEFNARSRVNEESDVFTRNIARNITAALFYNLMLMTRDNTHTIHNTLQNSRKTSYVLDFMSLLQNKYKKERTVKYYADKLCITPKYLSLLIKEATGKSAADWIDECVILEAKNLLRFSGMNIQQVSYELNFPNQSAFGKYFKHITGMSPSCFQNT